METIKIIKIGGNVIDDPMELKAFLRLFSNVKGMKILVHGGGKSATKLAQKMQVNVNMVDGRRITDSSMLNIVTMVFAGEINKKIVAQLQQFKCNSIGFSGADGNTIISEKRPVKKIDYGFVGDVKKVNIEVLKTLLAQGITPVFCAITHDEKGQLLNTNADTIAAELAIAFASQFKTVLYYCFEKNGVLEDVDNENSVIQQIDTNTYRMLIKNNIISAGMLPKLNNCFQAVEHKVTKVCIGKPSMLNNLNTNYTTIKL